MACISQTSTSDGSLAVTRRPSSSFNRTASPSPSSPTPSSVSRPRGTNRCRYGAVGQVDRAARLQPGAVQRGAAVVQGDGRVVPGDAGSDRREATGQHGLVDLVLLIAGGDAGLVRYHPHLHEMHWLRGRLILFRMQDSATCRHALCQARVDHSAIAGGILMRQLTLQHPGHYLHVPVWVRVESCCGRDDVVVIHQEQPVMGVVRIVVVAERERMPGREPRRRGDCPVGRASYLHGFYSSKACAWRSAASRSGSVRPCITSEPKDRAAGVRIAGATRDAQRHPAVCVGRPGRLF